LTIDQHHQQEVYFLSYQCQYQFGYFLSFLAL